jgi:hypothetical protein
VFVFALVSRPDAVRRENERLAQADCECVCATGRERLLVSDDVGRQPASQPVRLNYVSEPAGKPTSQPTGQREQVEARERELD